MSSNLTLLRLSLTLTLVAVAAGPVVAGHPAVTAVDSFARAYRGGDLAAAKAALMPHQREALTIDEETQNLLDSALVREAVEQTAAAVFVRLDMNGQVVTAPVHVVKQGFDWFVDLEATMGSLMGAAMGGASVDPLTSIEPDSRLAVAAVNRFFAAQTSDEAMSFVLPEQRDSGFSVTPQATAPEVLGAHTMDAAVVTVTFPPLSRSVHTPISMSVPCRRVDGEWLVDFDGLKGGIVKISMMTAMSEMGQEIGEAMAEGMQQVAQGLAEGMTEAMSTMMTEVSSTQAAAPTDPPAAAPTGSGGWAGEMDGQRRPGSYTVQRGDTLWEVSRWAYGDPMWYDKIAEANDMNPHYDSITIGQVLVIPVRNF